MSVDYRTQVCRGWIIDPETIHRIATHYPDTFEEWVNEGKLICQNSWIKDSNYIFAINGFCVTVDESSILTIDEIEWPKPRAYEDIENFHKMFGREYEPIHRLVFTQVF